MRVYGDSFCFRLRPAEEVWRRCRLFIIGRWVIFYTPHINGARAQHWLGVVKRFPQISRLLQVLSPNAPVDVAPNGDLEAETAYGNHPSSESHTGAVCAKIVQDVVNGREARGALDSRIRLVRGVIRHRAQEASDRAYDYHVVLEEDQSTLSVKLPLEAYSTDANAAGGGLGAVRVRCGCSVGWL